MSFHGAVADALTGSTTVGYAQEEDRKARERELKEYWKAYKRMYTEWYADQRADIDAARASRQQAIDDMLETWAIARTGSREDFGRSRARTQEGAARTRGRTSAALQEAGLSADAAGGQVSGALAADQIRQLSGVDRRQAAEGYSQWMDRASIEANTPWDGTTFNLQAPAPGTFQPSGGPTNMDWINLGLQGAMMAGV